MARTSLRTRLLRWDRVLVATAIALPFLALSLLGFAWLLEHGWLLHFLFISIGIGGVVTLIRIVLRRWPRRGEAHDVVTEGAGVAADPDWGPQEVAAYQAAQTLIAERTREPVPWEDMQPLALEVVATIAAKSGAKAKSPLDFTLSEALLLIERVASRFRTDLRQMVPFSDSFNLRSYVWLWKHRGRAQAVANVGHGVWRLFRLVKNPPAAVMQEIDRAVAGGHSSYLTLEAMAIGQGVLLEEVAKAAVDLYSGRLRFSDAEILEMQLAEGDRDAARQAAPDAPVRIVVAGQVSSGKSTLINALIGGDWAETDLGPTTAEDATYPVTIDSTECVLVDLPGLDGTKAIAAQVRAEMDAADIILWVMRANRPARAIDAEVLAGWTDTIAADPARRPPPVIPVLTAVDTLDPDWPHPEHHLPAPVRDHIAAAVQSVGSEMDVVLPVPVSGISPAWNLDTLRQNVSGHMAEALMVQRNRARIAAGRPAPLRNLQRGVTGISRGVMGVGKRLGRRWLDDEG